MDEFEDRLRAALAAKAVDAPDPGAVMPVVRRRMTTSAPRRRRLGPVLLSTAAVAAAIGLVFYVAGIFDQHGKAPSAAVNPSVSPPVGPTTGPPTNDLRCAKGPITVTIGNRRVVLSYTSTTRVTVSVGQLLWVSPRKPGGCMTLSGVQSFPHRLEYLGRAGLDRGAVVLALGTHTRPPWILRAAALGTSSFGIDSLPCPPGSLCPLSMPMILTIHVVHVVPQPFGGRTSI